MDWKRKLFPLTAVLLCTSVVIATSAIADDEAPAIRGKSTLKASTGWATNPDGAAQGSSGATVGTTTPGRTPLAIHQGTPLPPTEKLDKWDPSRTHSVSDLDTNQQRGGLRATGDDCSDPYVITSLPYTDQNDTTGRGVDYGTYEDCSGPTIYSDVVYSYTPTADIALRISTCSTDVEAGSHNQDTRLLIFEDSCTGDVASCNDDSLDSCIVEWPEQPQDASRMATVDGFIAELGHTYYIVVTEWGDEGDENCGDGTYELNVRLADPGGCCHIVPPPDSCSNGVYSPDCLGLADVFTPNTACPSPCQEDPDPTDHDCPEDVIWGPGTSGSTWYVGNAISDAGAVDRKQYEAFWNLEDPIAALRVWGVTANFDWDTACNKFENVDFFVEFWSESGDFGPGTLVHGPWRIARGPDLTVLDYGVGFTDSSNTYQVDLTLPQVVTMDTGWVTVYADIDPTQPDCYFRWPSDAQGDTGMDEPSGDNRSWRAQVGEIPGDMALCMSPPGAPGACCDQEGDFSCSNGVDAADCAQPKRWVQETSQGEDVCARFDGFDLQQCGIGACCHADGSCTEDTKADCETASGVWSAGAFCAQTAHDPDGHHCPPANDECTSVSPTARGDFSETFTGRNDGTTADVAEVGAAAWEAFTNPNPCSDITIDYCTTDPMFTAIATPYLLPSCTGYDNRIESSSSSTTDRESGDPLCCLDDPPGYDANYMISFENVPAGDFWIPVRTQTGSTGAYTIHVTGTDCTIDDPAEDCNDNGFHDVADVVSGTSADCNSNMVPDECECGDFDDDGVTGLDDYALFQGCYSGPVTTVSGCDCTFFDNDLDSDVDLYDYWWFQQCRGALACATCPADATVIEDEADCGLPTDTTNGGCNTGGTDFEALVNGSKFCGTFASSNGTSNGEPNSIRDTDWYEFTLLSDSTVTLNFVGEAPADVSLVNGDCDELYGVSAGTPAACEPIDGFSTDLPAGTYYLVVAPQFDDDLEVPCPTRYNGGLSWTATTLPTGACCPPDEFCVQRKEFTCSVERGEYHGDGSSCTPDPCEELPPIGPLCPANSIFGPGHSTNHGTAATSDQSPENGTEAIQVYENFWKLTEDITAVKFWGIELTNDPDLGFTDGCTKGRVFTYSFWKDTTYVDAEGVTRHQPDYDAGPVYKETWALTARTLITYDQWGPTIPMYEYDYTFESPVNLRGGWISVLRHYWSFAPTCWFLWANNEASLAGDDWSWQTDFGTDTVGGSSDYDMTLCLIGAAGPGPGGGPCEESCGANPVEGEPECADNYDDTFNSGCPTLYTCVSIACVDSNGCPGTACVNNLCVDPACPTGFDCIDNLCSDPAHPAPYNDPPVTQIACGETICGKGGHYGSDIPCDDNDDCILDGDDYGPCVGGPGGVCSVLNSSRDTDWYEVTIPEAMELTWDVYSDFDALTGFVPFDPPGSANCYDMDGAAIDPAAIGGGCNETVVDAAAGTQRMFVAPLFDDADITGDEIACDGSGPVGNEYFATLICTPASTLDAPGDTCETATDLGVSASGYWSGNIDGTEGFEGDDGDCLDPGDDQCPMPCSLNFNSDVDVWYKWTAPSAACRVTFQTCGYDVTDQVNGGTDVPTIVGIWTGACSGLVQYDDQTGTGEPEAPSAGCGGGDPGYMGSWPTCTGPEDESCPEALTCTAIGGGNYECRYGGNRHCETTLATVTIDAVADQDYYIQVLTDGGQYGLVTLDVSECVDACE